MNKERSIAALVRNAKGTNHGWYIVNRVTPITKDDGQQIVLHTLKHYRSTMLVWHDEDPSIWGPRIVAVGLGHGAKWEQYGMNKAFEALDSKYRYLRKGTCPSIVDGDGKVLLATCRHDVWTLTNRNEWTRGSKAPATAA